ncbi:MAG: P-loop NTPase [candidate division NC10 bacterium]|nr:P-loop NTPase [candidate division NC10 bacterium]
MLQEGSGLSGIRCLVGFASGKGGVGRSTVLVNLGVMLAEKGAKVGLLDADLEDPGLLPLLGIQGRPEIEEGKIFPFEEYGVKALSLDFLLEGSSPSPSELPQEPSFLQEKLQTVAWGELEYLLIELPPGRGTITRLATQAFPFAGIVLVMTPQTSAVPALGRTAELYRGLKIPIVGVIENMSFLLCPYCLKGIEVFGHGLGRMMSLRLKAAHLGEIPIDPGLRLSGERGEVLVALEPRSPIAEVFKQVADNLVERFKKP